MVEVRLAILREILCPPRYASWSRRGRRCRLGRWCRVRNGARLTIRRPRRMSIRVRRRVGRRSMLRIGRGRMTRGQPVTVVWWRSVARHRGTSRTGRRHMRNLLTASAAFAFVCKLDLQRSRGSRQSLSSVQLPNGSVGVLHPVHPHERRSPAFPGVILHDHHLSHHAEGLKDAPQLMLLHHGPPGQASDKQLGVAPGGRAIVLAPGHTEPVRLTLGEHHRHWAQLVEQRHPAVDFPDSRHGLIHMPELHKATSLALPGGPVAEAVHLNNAPDTLKEAAELVLGEISW
mmetsp:Transcript_7692/g.16553  ORF Transcript_7692/g.16553 Transcript_7692/m.16553 type:complete len:288 (+) Transcript_7692:600-1463(+)